MKSFSDHLYKKIYNISQEVLESFRKKGIVIPQQLDNGTIKIGYYIISKNQQGFYSIHSTARWLIVDRINLPQTAILLANNLSLGKFLDNQLLDLDKQYGYALFEESVYKKIIANKKTNVHKVSLSMAKIDKIKYKKESCKRLIDKNFEKLRKIA